MKTRWRARTSCYLHQDADGRTVDHGRYAIVDTGSLNGEGAFQFDLVDSGSIVHGSKSVAHDSIAECFTGLLAR